MKFRTNFLYATLLFSGLILFTTGCKEDDPPARDKFLGAYTVVETCGNGNDSYDITVVESGVQEEAIIIANLYDAGAQISATVNGNNLNIENQMAGGINYVGTGSLSNNILTINFTVSAGGATDNCSAICTQK